MSRDIWLQCPDCGQRWHEAILAPGDGVTPETIAKQSYCVECDYKPPMRLVEGDLVKETP